jgi:hypothetical protein
MRNFIFERFPDPENDAIFGARLAGKFLAHASTEVRALGVQRIVT